MEDTELQLLRRLEKHTRAWFKTSGAHEESIMQDRMKNVMKKLKRLRKVKPISPEAKIPRNQLPKRASGEHEKIEAIRQWAFDHDWFNTDFIEQLSEAFEKYGHLTPSQEQALDNIMDKFEI